MHVGWRAVITVGGDLSLWDPLLLDWPSDRGQAQRVTDTVFIDWGPEIAAQHNLGLAIAPALRPAV